MCFGGRSVHTCATLRRDAALCAMKGARLCRSEARRDMETPLDVFVGTWNLGNAAPDEEYFRDVLSVASEADILCLGFQEAHYSVKDALSFEKIAQLSSELGRGSSATRKLRNATWFRNMMKVRGCRRKERPRVERTRMCRRRCADPLRYGSPTGFLSRVGHSCGRRSDWERRVLRDPRTLRHRSLHGHRCGR